MDHLDLDHFRVDVTDQDIAVARHLWIIARDDGDTPDGRVATLFHDLCMLMSAQAQQMADDFRATR